MHREERYIKEFIKGDSEAFEALFSYYGRRIHSFVLRYTKSVADSDDIVQNTFISLWEIREQIKNRESLKSLIFQITYNEIQMLFRKRSYEEISKKQNPLVSVDIQEEQIEYSSILDHVYTVIEQLPPQKKRIFKMKRIEGRSSKEIAEILNISAGTVDNHISEATKLIRKAMPEKILSIALFFSLFI